MAALGNDLPTLLDQIKRTDPNGAIAQIVEAQSKRDPILQDAVAMEGNLPTGHRVTIRSGLPSVGYRLLNQGIAASKSTTIQVDEACALLEGRSEVDCELARLNGNEAAFRASEDRSFMQSLMHQAAETLFYGSTATAPEEFHGLTPRYDSLSGDNADNVVDAGLTPDGSLDQASIWFVTWGPDTASLIYPKGMVGGIDSTDLGKEYVEDASGNKFLAYRSHWVWRLGLCIKDWRYHVRICNIDASKMATALATPGSTQLINAMVEAYNRVRDFSTGRTVIYANRAVVTMLDRQVMDKANVWFAPMEWHGRKINSFRGIPIVLCDSLISTEAEVS